MSVIGCGEMGSAIVEALDHEVIACESDMDELEGLDVREKTSKPERAGIADVVFLAVRPGQVEDVLTGLELSEDQVLVSVAAGVSMDFLERFVDSQVARVMPNLAAEHGEAAVGACLDRLEYRQEVRDILEDLGAVVEVEEDEMDLVTSLAGSGPAFVYRLIESFSSHAVDRGMDRERAERLATVTFRGAASTAMESDQDLSGMIESVCSEGGTTIEGIRELRQSDIDRDIAETLARTERKARRISSEFSGRDLDPDRVVVKIGSSSVTDSSGVDREMVESVVRQIDSQFSRGRELVLVSSGAVRAGKCMTCTGSGSVQTCATVGQSLLTRSYLEAGEKMDRDVAQLLVDKCHLDENSVSRTLEELLESRILPLVNENDGVGNRIGENDRIAARIARSIDADLLVILTDVDGIRTDEGGGERIGEADHRIEKVLEGSADSGIVQKIEAAISCREEGIDTVITDASKDDVLERTIRGEDLGTFFRGDER